MKGFDFGRLDLNSLRLLCSIHDEGSLTIAGERSGIAQSTVSHTLEKLRKSFDDPLFLRTGRGVTPTERCTKVVAQLRPLLGEIYELGTPDTFAPDAEGLQIVIGGNFYERTVFLPSLMRHLADPAPQARVTFLHSLTRSFDMLARGECDLALGPIPPNVSPSAKIRSEILLRDSYACFVDARSHLASGEITTDVFANAPHLIVRYAEGWTPMWKSRASELGIDYRARLNVPSYGGVDSLLRGSHMILTAPSGLHRFLPDDIAMCKAPFECSFDVNLMWSPKTDRSGQNIWLRDLVRSCATQLTAAA